MPINKQTSGHRNAVFQLAQTHIERGEFSKALLLFTKSLEESKRDADVLGEAITCYQIGQLKLQLGNTDEAQNVYHRSLSLFKQLDDLQGIATAMMGLAEVHLMQGNFEESLSTYETSLSIFRSIGDNHNIGIALSQLANVHWELGNIEQAEKLVRESLIIGEKFGHKPSIAMREYKLGQLAQEKKDFDEALKHYHSARVLFEELNMPEFFEVENDISILSEIVDSPIHSYGHIISTARAFVDKGDFQSAIVYQEKAVHLLQGYDISSATTLCILLYDLARYYQAVGNFLRGIQILEEVVVISQQTQQSNIELTRGALAHAYWLQEQKPTQKPDLLRLLHLARKICDDAIEVRRKEIDPQLFEKNYVRVLSDLDHVQDGSPEADLAHFLRSVTIFLLSQKVAPIPFTYFGYLTKIQATQATQ